MTLTRVLAAALLPILVFPPQVGLAQEKMEPAAKAKADGQLDGYSKAASDMEREWEGKFRAMPEPNAIKENMRRLSARPHHVGSPYDKDNAEWMLAKFKEWGWDASIENFTCCFLRPRSGW